MRHLLAKTPLRLILIVPFVAQITSVVGLTAWLSIRNGQKAVQDVVAQLLDEVSHLTLDRIPTYLEKPQRLNATHVNDAERGQIDVTGDIRALSPYLIKSLQTFDQVSFTVFASQRGHFIGARRQTDGSQQIGVIDTATEDNLQYYSTNYQGDFIQLLQDIEIPPGDVLKRPWYEAAVNAQAPTWSEVYTTRSTESLVITSAQPVYNDRSELLGVFSTTISLGQIDQFLKSIKIGQSGQIFIIDKAGRLIASSTGERLYRVVNRNGSEKKELLAASESDDPLTRATAEVLFQTNSLVSMETAQPLELVANQGPVFVTVTPLSKYPDLDWRIVVVAPEADFMSQIYANTRNTIWLCIGALGLAIGSSIFTARWIMRPLLQLNQTAKDITGGSLQLSQLSGQSVTSRTREVSELSQSFHRMTQQLQTSLIQLQDLTNRLELAAQSAKIGIWDWDIVSNRLIWDSLMYELYGLPPRELGGEFGEAYETWEASIHPDDLKASRTAIQETLRGEKDFDLEFRILWPDGTVRYIEAHAMVQRDASGHPLRMIGVNWDITNRKRTEERLIYGALHDALTDLPNRTLLTRRLESAIQRAQRSNTYHFAVLFLDLDQFKVINDSLGHLIGDQLLLTVAHTLQILIRATDLAARLGGDEFVILLEHVSDIQAVIHMAERLLAEFDSARVIDGHSVFTTTSIGIVWGTRDYTDPSDLLRDADIALYRAKAKGRRRYEIFDVEMHFQAVKRMKLEHDLRVAIDRQEFVTYYQPIVDIKTRRLIGFEALIRWQHPLQGFISPTNFIPVAEETGLIVPISQWILRSACQQIATWQRQFPDMENLKVSINLSVQDLQQTTLFETIQQTLNQAQLSANSLTLEITESMLIDNIETTIGLLERLRNLGIRISIDDFGTGYSSLSYLYNLPADYLKIDQSFVSNMQPGNKNYKIVQAVVSLSDQLQLVAIAEGIEAEQQLEWLKQLSCELGQGYLLSRPLPPESAETLLSSGYIPED